MAITERNDGEKFTPYFKRIVGLAADKRITYSEMGDALLGVANVYSEDNLRKAFYVLNKVCDKFEEDYITDSSDIIAEIEEKRDELYKARVKYRDKLREYNKKLTEEARFENLKDTLLMAVADNKSHLPVRKNVDYSPASIEASLIISDLHYGLKIDNQVNYYDTEVASERIAELVDKTIEYCKLYKVQTLHCCILGDIISGIIKVSCRVEQEEDFITQIINSAELLAEAVQRLAESIPEVRAYTVFGNHSRVMENKTENVNRENVERLLYHYMKAVLPKDIKFLTSMNDDYLVTKIAGKTVVMEHGDKTKNPVIDYVNILGYVPDEIYRGHYHSFSVRNENDVQIITNGSVVGTDDYALSIRKSTKPSQTLRVYGRDISTFEIVLE